MRTLKLNGVNGLSFGNRLRKNAQKMQLEGEASRHAHKRLAART